MTTPWAWRWRSRRLARRLPPDSAGAVLGDLHEEYGARLERDGRARAEWWLVRQTWSLSRAYASYEHTRRSLWSSARVLRPGELTQTIRSLARSPWYTATAIAVIALGTALGTVIFAIVDGTLFKPLPYPDSSRLFAVSLGYSRLPDPFRPDMPVSPVTVAEWRAGAPDIALTAFSTGGGFRLAGGRELVRNADVDEHFFDVLGIRPVAGGFSPGDFDARTPIRPAIVTATFWRERFGSAAEAIGQTLTDETGAGIRIVGAMPNTFVFPLVSNAKFTPQVLTPLVRDTTSRGDFLHVLVRLRPNADVRSTAERINAIVAAQAAARPPQTLPAELPPRLRIMREGLDRGGLMSIDEMLRSYPSTRASVVFAAAAALMLLACFNVTGLAIARGRERHSDLTVRRALGASTRDLIRLLALETVLIVTAGAAMGLLIAWWTLPVGARLFAGDFMLTLKPAVIDVRVAAFSALVAIAGSLIVILLSARSVSRVGIRQSLTESTGTTRRVARRLSMISFEVAVAYLVTITAALVVGSLIRAWSEDTGFDVPDVALLGVTPRNPTSDDIDRLIADIRKIPDVQAAGGVAHNILEQAFNGSVFDSPPGIASEEVPLPGGGMSFPIESVPVTSGFFPAAGLQPRDGRLPTEDEFRRGVPLVVVTDTVARHYWPGQRAVGQVLLNKGRPFEVIGVVNDTRLLSLDLPAQGEIFWPIAAMPRVFGINVVIKFAAGTSTNIDTVAASVRERCHDCWIFRALTLEDAMSESIRPRRFSAWLFSGFGIAALLIVGTGVLGVMAMTTTGRVREIGIRMALGATARGVVSQLLREQITSVILGIVAGGLAAAWATKLLTSYLYKTEPTDAIAWAAAAAAILLVAFAGAFVPARRASRIDPVKALRVE